MTNSAIVQILYSKFEMFDFLLYWGYSANNFVSLDMIHVPNFVHQVKFKDAGFHFEILVHIFCHIYVQDP